MPKLQHQLSKIDLATVSASLFEIAATTAYLVKSSVMQRMLALLRSVPNMGNEQVSMDPGIRLVWIESGASGPL
jgi:hypothetical protein